MKFKSKFIKIRSRKASSFFLFDAVIAAIIFFMTVAIIMSMRNVEPEIDSPKSFGEDLMEYYLETEVRDIEDSEIGQLLIDKKITDPTNTLLEQMVIFYAYDWRTLNDEFVGLVSLSKIPPNYGFNVSLINDTDTTLIHEKNVPFITPTSDIRLRRVVITKLNDGTLFGPVTVEISVWY